MSARLPEHFASEFKREERNIALKKLIKCWLAAALALVMCVSLLPVNAFATSEQSDPCPHYVVRPDGYDEEGYYVGRCTLCGETLRVVFTAECGGTFYRRYNEAVNITPGSNCKDGPLHGGNGVHEHKCDYCHGDMVRWSEWKLVEAATCTTDGRRERHCTYPGCGVSSREQIEIIPALGHAYEGEVTREPSCTEKGEATYTCTRCEDVYTETIEMTPHLCGDLIPEVEPTCTTDGVEAHHVCAVCEKLFQDAIECAAEDLVIPALGHAYGEWETVMATCTEDGQEKRICANDASHVETRTIEATGHVPGETVIENAVAATCTAEGSYDEVVYCTECNTELSRNTVAVEAIGHNYVVTGNIPPSETTDGRTVYTCTHDAAHTYTVILPATGEVEIEDVEVPLAGLFTRADAIGYLWQEAGSPEAELSDFEDVPEDHPWAVAIGWAQDMGIAVADEDGCFRPDDLVLRATEETEGELQEFLNRYAVFAGIELDADELFIELDGEPDDIIMGEEAQVIFDDFFARLEAALTAAA